VIAGSAVARRLGNLLREVEYQAEAADLARRTYDETARPDGRLGSYHDGSYHASLLILAYVDGAQLATLEERTRLHREEEAAVLGRRAVIGLDNENSALHLYRFDSVKTRAWYACVRARRTRGRVPLWGSVPGLPPAPLRQEVAS
jgi:hypothetical protein